MNSRQLATSSMSRVSAARSILDNTPINGVAQFGKPCRAQSSTSTSTAQHTSSPTRMPSRSYTTETTAQQPASFLTIPTPSTSAHHGPRLFKPPPLSLIRSNLPPRQNTLSNPQLHRGTVTHVGTMTSTVQISYNAQGFDPWFQRRTQQTVRVSAHEPTGYLRAGDVVEFARFTPATMAERYESGKLNRRGGGVRYEVHRVVTPFGERVEDRSEVPREGEVGDRFGAVEFERRKKELGRPWNKDAKRRVGIVEGMYEAVAMEVEKMRKTLGFAPRQARGSGQSLDDAKPQFSKSGTTIPEEPAVEEMSEAQKDIVEQLQKLRGNSL